MIWFLYGTAGLLILFFLSRIYISIILLYTDHIQSITIKITLYRVRLYKNTVPIIPEHINFPNSKTEFEGFLHKLSSLLEGVKLMQQMLGFILIKLKLHRLYWVTEGGTGDAA